MGSEGTTVCGAFCEARNVVRNVSRRGSRLAVAGAGVGSSSSPVRKLKDGCVVLRTAMVAATPCCFVCYGETGLGACAIVVGTLRQQLCHCVSSNEICSFQQWCRVRASDGQINVVLVVASIVSGVQGADRTKPSWV